MVKKAIKMFTKKDEKTSNQYNVSFIDEILNCENEFLEKKGIIVVPSSLVPGNISKFNAVEFLRDGVYTLPEENDDDPANIFFKDILGKQLKFEVRSDVYNFSKYDWRRVVAVFVKGVEWEFENWPSNETSLSILLKVKGFYLKYDDLPISANVQKLKVSIKNVMF